MRFPTCAERRRLIALAALGCAAGGAFLLFRFDLSRSPFYPHCVFHALTGLQCPGCGGTRAIHALLHGDFARAFWFNPLLLLYAPIVGLGILAELRGKPLVIRPSITWCVVVTICSFWIVRNLSWYPYFR